MTTSGGAAAADPPTEPLTGEVRIYGNRLIKSYIIRREIPLQRGDRFDPDVLKASARRIRALPGVDHSEVAVFISPEDSTLAVSVSITEKSAIEGKIRFDRGRENDMGAGLNMTHYNLRGRSERLWSSFLLGSGQQFELGWENPWIATDRHIGVGVRGVFEDYDYVYHDLGDPYAGARIQRIGGEASVFWSRGGPSRVFFTAGYQSVDSKVDEVTLSDGRDNYATVALGTLLDGRDGRRFPWKGAYLKTVARQIGPGAENFDIFEGTVDARAFIPVSNRTVIAAHSQFVYRDGNTIPSYMREHIGGVNTLRGYEYGSFNGTNSLVGGLELRVPANFSRTDPMEDLLLGLELHAFVDAGGAWERGEDVDPDLIHTTYGLGFTVMNRNFAPIRFDWGWHEDSSVDFGFDVGMKF